MVRYRCKPEHAEQNAALLEALFQELAERGVGGVRYAVFKVDPVSFVHLVVTETDDLLGPLDELPAYRRLQDGKTERFQGPPEVLEVEELGTFGVFE